MARRACSPTRPAEVRRWLTLCALAACGVVSPAHAALPQQAGSVDLLTQANITLAGASGHGDAGYVMSLGAAGDVNGDGYDDVIVGLPYFSDPARGQTGTAFVLFGSSSPANVDVATLTPSQGFRIRGAAVKDSTGATVAGVGDVNGDGIDDVGVGSVGANPSGNAVKGCVHVVFGSATVSDVDLADPGARAVRFDGVASFDDASTSVSAGGDLNADGIDDVVVGSPYASPQGRSAAGSVFVVFGSRQLSGMDLGAALGTRGVAIAGAVASDQTGTSVAATGDVNGDGIDDLAIGAPTRGAGRAYVLFGGRALADTDLGALGTAGVRLDGESSDDNAGWSVAGVGDVNGDGARDVAVSATNAAPAGRTKAGRTYVVHGGRTLASGTLAAASTHVDGAAANDMAGWTVAGVGDVNGDGIADLAVGAPLADPSGQKDAGRAYVVFGSSSPTNVDLASLPATAGVVMNGTAAGAFAGSAIAGADLNRDGHADVFVSHAGDATNPMRGVYGWGAARIAYGTTSVSATVGTPITPLTPTIGRTGPATITVSPALPQGLAIDASTGVVSGTPAVAGTTTHVVTTTDLAGSATTTLTVTVAAVAPAPAPRLVRVGRLKVAKGVAILPVTALERGRYTLRFGNAARPLRLTAGSRAVVFAGKKRRVVALRRASKGLSLRVTRAPQRLRLEVRTRLPRKAVPLVVDLVRPDGTRARQVITLRVPRARR